MFSGKDVLFKFLVVIKKYTDFVVPADKRSVTAAQQLNWQSGALQDFFHGKKSAMRKTQSE
jgi:hypothetical protein